MVLNKEVAWTHLSFRQTALAAVEDRIEVLLLQE